MAVAYILVEVQTDENSGFLPEDDALLALNLGQYSVVNIDIMD